MHAVAPAGAGMAAVSLAVLVQRFSLTASRARWDTLWAMGFDDIHISDSRSLEFGGGVSAGQSAAR